MRSTRPSEDTVTLLVDAARAALWRRRFLQTGNTIWSVLAVALLGLTVVHRSVANLPVSLTLTAAVVAIVATAGWRLLTTRPSLDDSLREADRLAGTDMLMASAWSVREADAGKAGWGTLEVQRSARRTAGKALAAWNIDRDRQPLRLPSYTSALVVMAAALVMLAQPIGQETVVATVPPTGSAEPENVREARRAPDRDADTAPDTAAREPQVGPDTPQALADAEPPGGAQPPGEDTGPAAMPGGTPGGDLPSTLPAAGTPGTADTASTPDAIEFVDIRRRGARTASAQSFASSAGDDSDGTETTGDAEPWVGWKSVAPPPLDADPVTRHYLSRWQTRREAQR